jgi:hypothetical protein
MWFDFVQLAGLEERCEHGTVLSACIMAREERVFALQGDWAFNGVTVHLDRARYCRTALVSEAIYIYDRRPFN